MLHRAFLKDGYLKLLHYSSVTHRNIMPAPTFSTPSMPLGPGASTYRAAGAPAECSVRRFQAGGIAEQCLIC